MCRLCLPCSTWLDAELLKSTTNIKRCLLHRHCFCRWFHLNTHEPPPPTKLKHPWPPHPSNPTQENFAHKVTLEWSEPQIRLIQKLQFTQRPCTSNWHPQDVPGGHSQQKQLTPCTHITRLWVFASYTHCCIIKQEGKSSESLWCDWTAGRLPKGWNQESYSPDQGETTTKTKNTYGLWLFKGGKLYVAKLITVKVKNLNLKKT